MLTQHDLEKAIDAKQLYTYCGGYTNQTFRYAYRLCERTGSTRKLKTGFSIPATPGHINHNCLKALNSKTCHHDNKPAFIISASDPNN